MTTISITRPREINNSLRDYIIFIDGHKAGNIANGKTKDFETTPGVHLITAKIDWCSSPDTTITIRDNETKILIVGGFKNGKFLMPIGLGIFVLHFVVSYFFDFEYTLFLMMPIFFLLIYYLTLGRKHYLTLEEQKIS
ncbi:MAG TPA: hypothetical protein PKC06_15480 [Saprospiraceae bacterium]|jgi:hypothetical protein|nr:hypothetical protein [Saprospiraceae bacterium]